MDRSYRPGLGDLAVVIALLLLGWFTFGPHLSGRTLAAFERSAQTRLKELHDALATAGVLEALAACEAQVRQSQPDLLPIAELPSDAVAGWFLPTWEDDSYYYRLDPYADHVTAMACPRQPGIGNMILADRDGALTEMPYAGPKVDRPPTQALPQAEAAARDRTRALLAIGRKSGLPTAWPIFLAAAKRLPLRAVPPSSTEELPGAADRFPVWRDDSTWYRAWILHDVEGKSFDMVVFAWPDQPGRSGFAAYRRSTASLRQSRNMAVPYVGLSHFPRPGAGLRRAGSRIDRSGGYTGQDGNRWFQVR